MTVDALRLIVDRSEWDSMARNAPTVYHEQSWTFASVRRIRTQTSKPVTFGYARVWIDDTLVGCPLIRLGDGAWFNTPRAVPAVIEGVNLNAVAALLRAIARAARPLDLVLHDDSDLLQTIARDQLEIDVASTTWRRFRTMSGREVDTLVRALAPLEPHAAYAWGDALKAIWMAACWATEVRVHRDGDDELVGCTVWATRAGFDPECIGAFLAGDRAPTGVRAAWTVIR